jgi:hypothetical protein
LLEYNFIVTAESKARSWKMEGIFNCRSPHGATNEALHPASALRRADRSLVSLPITSAFHGTHRLGLEVATPLPEIDASLALADLYERVEFA